MVCKQCAQENESSCVIIEGTESTCAGFFPFYDEHGAYHSHDPNRHTTTYRCTRGHRWQERQRVKCPACGQWWNLMARNTKEG
jgi:hypothetical protein